MKKLYLKIVYCILTITAVYYVYSEDCLGVMKRLIEHWTRGKRDICMNESNIQEVNDALSIKDFVPSEFCRLPRSLSDIDYWKATELRLFLLYSGLIILKSKLKKTYILIFIIVFSIRILVCFETCYSFIERSECLLKQWNILLCMVNI